ncbi:MAG TPA: hypothetical protein VGR91_13065 [Stellaceae bacterium]|nr:hypothetical protein [Stellaceae bacterium]
MRNSAKSWISAALFLFASVFSLGYVQPARAFTLIELLVIPPLELVTLQEAAVTITNTSGNAVQLVATAYNDRGFAFKQEGSEANPITVAPNTTFRFSVRAPATGNLSVHTVVELSAANAAVADVMGFDSNTGQVISLMPGRTTFPQAQLLPAVQLVASQSALVKVTNTSPNDASATINLYNAKGTLFKQLTTPLLAPNVTFTHRVMAPATGNLTFFATINWGDGSPPGVSDVMALGRSSGQVIAILPFVETGN